MTVQFHNNWLILGIVILLVSLFMSFLYSASEVALFSLKKSYFTLTKKKKTNLENKIYKVISEPDSLLATILIGNNFVNLCFIILFVYITNSIVKNISGLTLFILQTIVASFIILLFGEIIPKAIATVYSFKMSCFTINFILFSKFLFKPLVSLLKKFNIYLSKNFISTEQVELEDLLQYIEEINDTGFEEKRLLKGIINVIKIRVKNICVPRIDVKTIDINDSFKTVTNKIKEHGYSRMPVINKTIDNIVGVLYIKDFIEHYNKDNFKWQSLIRKPYFVPETMYILDLLEKFQQEKIHLAIVVNEYGGVTGIITLEDIIEEIIGNIDDEFDEEQNKIVKINENTYEVEGKLLINDFLNYVNLSNLKLSEMNVDTIAGLILEHCKVIPEPGHKIKIENFEFTILQADQRKIKKVKIKILNADENN
ncbi:MAG: CNNM domain-containing protein [Bacteroidales bacterium]|nr:CNNM domain-containing protein [Bacteroidales bacterium]